MVRNVEPSASGSGTAVQVTAPQQISQKTIPALERQIDDAIAQKPEFIDVNCAATQVIDSLGLNWLLSVQSRSGSIGIQVRISDPSPVVADILLATRLDVRFAVHYPGGGVRNG